MNKHRITAMTMSVALASFINTLVADERIPAAPAGDNQVQNVTEQKPEMENLAPQTDSPVQAIAPPSDNLLSEMKVYPSF